MFPSPLNPSLEDLQAPRPCIDEQSPASTSMRFSGDEGNVFVQYSLPPPSSPFSPPPSPSLFSPPPSPLPYSIPLSLLSYSIPLSLLSYSIPLSLLSYFTPLPLSLSLPLPPFLLPPLISFLPFSVSQPPSLSLLPSCTSIFPSVTLL
ncbi:hypothetical protein JAAARDRAFT_197487 [Jaapia argillacea MUCL 33604]|uniref:Uncharacterized protein n=1 Tax=Jaapia argillacea MUCL 33604 TaxID=933084 RepID=A0A067PEI6_9AGAM|nr:hypothetical protein JAAARDRAFT_197487 [Jaapia argillacea MUCL 33604]